VTCFPPGGEEILVLLLADVDAAATAADDDAGARLTCAKPRIAPRLARRDHAKQRRARVAPRIGAPILLIVAIECRRVVYRHQRHPPRHAARVRGHVELRDGFGAADTAADVLPVTLAANAER
jgi:hypothetical protein